MNPRTPGDWKIKDGTAAEIVSAKGKYIACIGDPAFPPRLDDAANAEFIVRACNAHDALLAACKLALVDLVTVTALTDSRDAGGPTIDALRAAIALAETQP